ncbi:hypothetical protein OS493_039479 [Desmophyllum pertusum]|uniref:Uncharacterized protein n=1 Tax=Desmophyllum pertusum TaxID=174260 RepID=A0A9W9ZHM5_9CNID|nr:hypothetical protein OS493_039479 [Desmophyllum pertusum]
MGILPLSEQLLKKLEGLKSPAVVDVKASVIFEFDPEVSRGGKDATEFGIFAVDRVLTETVTPQQPHVPKETIPVAPLLDINTLTEKCNCALFPVTNGIFFKPAEEEEEEEESQDEVHCASDTQTYSPLNSDEEAGFSGGSYDGTSSEDR